MVVQLMLVFQVCFFSGVGFLAISFLFGQVFDFFDFDGFDLDGLDTHGIDFNSFFPLSPSMIILCITLFGGIGALLVSIPVTLHIWAITLIALVIAFGICILITRLLIVPLKRAQNTSAADQEELLGLMATVTETILENKFGEIRYTIHGNTYTSPAKGANGEAFLVGSQVLICYIEDHVFYVTYKKNES